MAELKLSGNHLKGSRPVLSFDQACILSLDVLLILNNWAGAHMSVALHTYYAPDAAPRHGAEATGVCIDPAQP